MAEEKIGVIASYFSKIGVAAINLTDGPLSVGDKILIKGNTTDFQQIVSSMQIEHNAVQIAEKGKSVGIKVNEKVRPNDIVYRIVD